jgi:hypothetical protein
MILHRLRNWCRNARFSPGLVVGGGIIEPDSSSLPRADAGGFRNSLLCASNVVGFVGWILTLEVIESL